MYHLTFTKETSLQPKQFEVSNFVFFLHRSGKYESHSRERLLPISAFIKS